MHVSCIVRLSFIFRFLFFTGSGKAEGHTGWSLFSVWMTSTHPIFSVCFRNRNLVFGREGGGRNWERKFNVKVIILQTAFA